MSVFCQSNPRTTLDWLHQLRSSAQHAAEHCPADVVMDYIAEGLERGGMDFGAAMCRAFRDACEKARSDSGRAVCQSH